MVIVLVYVHVKPDAVEGFREATMENARNSVNEAGVSRFDIVQQVDDPTRFVMIEVYRTEPDVLKHKETAHYKMWRETVEEMMAEPRKGVKHTNVFPDDRGWG
jgi:autoinducer 2-degrading protein